LQTNKVNKTIGRFALLHAIDAPHLGEAVSKANAAKNIRQPVLIQVNSTSDPTRHGVLPEQAASLLEQLLPLPGIEIRGLMTMAPADASIKGDRTELQRVFCGLRELRDQLATKFGMQLPELSMGMSHDYIHALECGATIIRIGNFLFKN
ncbi:MAG TPA: alanine racemase, partial [Oculatellaceae cyanobacterium]